MFIRVIGLISGRVFRVDLKSVFCAHIGFYIIVNPLLSLVKMGLVIKSSKYWNIGSILNTYNQI